MTKEYFINNIEGCINDYALGRSSKEETIEVLASLFMEALNPFLQSRNHLKLFLLRVLTMRELQQQYFQGKKSVLDKARLEEQKVDNAIKKLTGELGYSIEDLKKQAAQPKLDM